MRVELVTNLKRKATEILGEPAEDPGPVLITRHGRPAACLPDVPTFERMNDRITLLQSITREDRPIEGGRGATREGAKQRTKRWLE